MFSRPIRKFAIIKLLEILFQARFHVTLGCLMFFRSGDVSVNREQTLESEGIICRGHLNGSDPSKSFLRGERAAAAGTRTFTS